ncbi:Uma2 family endonuclease [Streptomyces fumanus]|uniref:Uma2 family endonuclease n=1 Tax=Streptomyces fumanus TaxID=67302 RepID=UPI0033F87861
MDGHVNAENRRTVDDLLGLPDLPQRIDLLDGTLIRHGPQNLFHSHTVDLLVHGIRRCAPAGFAVARNMTVVLDRHNAPEPDVSLLRADAALGPEGMSYQVEDVLLAVEVVTPDSASRTARSSPASTPPPASPTSGVSNRAGRTAGRSCTSTGSTRGPGRTCTWVRTVTASRSTSPALSTST